MDQLNFEEAEHIFGWREMRPGTYVFVDKEVRGMNKWMKPISVVTIKEYVGAPPIKFYAPPSLHYGLESRPNPKWIKYDGLSSSKDGFQYPIFKYAS